MPPKAEPELPPEYLQEIGSIAVAWNHLENLLHHTLILALQDDFAKDGRVIAVFTHVAFNQRMELLRAMLPLGKTLRSQVFDSYCKEIQPLLKKCAEMRNAVMHQPFSIDEGLVKKHAIKARGEFKIDFREITLDELKSTTALILSTQGKMFELVTSQLAP